MKEQIYLIAAAGTGGHILPGLAVADKISEVETGSRVIFIGTKTGMENKLLAGSRYTLQHIRAKGFVGKSIRETLIAPIQFLMGFVQSLRFIRKVQPLAVIGMGGYVSGPVVLAAFFLRKPILLHEQNAVPGKANVWLSKFADTVCISYPQTLSSFMDAHSVVVTGNPVRKEFYGITKNKARNLLGISQDIRLLFVTGGSLGARSINRAVAEMLDTGDGLSYQLVMACGAADFPDISQRFADNPHILKIADYLNDQYLYLAAADLVLCRSGAITCSEIAILGKASVMVPYPYAAGDHQTKNAKAFSDIGAAVCIPDKELTGNRLREVVDKLMADDLRRENAGKNALTLSYPNATELIYQQIRKLIEQEGTD